MHRTLYISDLDGTLLDENAKISDYAKRELIKLINKGMHFTVASARSIFSIKQILGDIPFEFPIISFNGGYIIDYKTEKIFHAANICEEAVEYLENWMKKNEVYPFISCLDGEEQLLLYKTITSGGMKWYLDNLNKSLDKRLKKFEEIDDIKYMKKMSYTFMDKEDKIEKIYNEFSNILKNKVNFQKFENSYSPGWFWLTIESKEATKAEGIKKMMEISKVKFDEIIVFGDHLNDYEMFDFADRAYAVSNAEDELKKIASDVIGSNLEDGVIKFLLMQ